MYGMVIKFINEIKVSSDSIRENHGQALIEATAWPIFSLCENCSGVLAKMQLDNAVD